jgi:hypothetical protein
MPQITTSLPLAPFARPERYRFALKDNAPLGTPLDLPRRSYGLAALIVAGMFVLFAGVLVFQIVKLDLHALRSVSALMGMLFQLFWILGWSAGVLILGALTLLLLFYRESARIADGRLFHIPSVGPLKMILEYDLARVSNPRVEPDAAGENARVRFDYDEGSRGLGDAMPRADAEAIVAALRAAIPADAATPRIEADVPRRPAPVEAAARAEAAKPPRPLASALTLAAANLVPLVGVVYGGWKLSDVLVLFWAESAIIGFYTLLKIAVVARWLAPFAGLFFVGHFGAFMAFHFLFLYEMFVRGPRARDVEPGALDAIIGVLAPLWPALLALFLSHGVSFAMNFLAAREYRGATVSGLMTAPYRRVVLMQLTIIFGGWMVLLLKSPMPALVLLIVLKVAVDLRAHRSERGAATLGDE